MEINLNKDERIDDLEYKNLKIIQNDNNFCFGMDSILLSDFAKNVKPNSTIVDLGTGTGIISILLYGKTKAKKIYGIEIQKEMSDMAYRSIKLNNLEGKVEIINEDIKNILKIFEKNSIDIVVTNPPYKEINRGIINESENKIISRHELKANLEDFIKASSEILKDYGEFYMVNRPERLADIIENLRKYKIEPKNIRLVYSKIDKEPKLILIKAVKNAKKFLKIEKPLIIYDEKSNYTEEIYQIYNKKRGNK